MKSFYESFLPTKSLARFTALAFGCFFLASCTTTTSLPPLTPSTPTGSTSISYGTPEILAAIAVQGGFVQPVQVEIMTTSQAVSTATITLTGPSVNLPVTFNYSISSGTTLIGYYNSTSGWAYQGNQNYTLSVNYSGYSGQGTVHSVGNVSFTPTGSGINISWLGGGNENTASAYCITPSYQSYVYGPNITSAYNIPQSGLAGYSGGNYTIGMNCNETVISAFSGGAFIGSSFTASDQESTTY